MNVDVIVMHGPTGCCFRTARLLEGDGVRVVTTGMSENDFILGAGEKLVDTLVEAYEDTLDVESPVQNALGPYPGTALRVGSSGSDVRKVQSALNAINGNNALVVDGLFGQATERAVHAFQNQNGLTVDGVVGQATWNQLNEVLISTYNALLTDLNSFRLRELIYDSYTDLMWNTTVNSIDY
jgi:peptidoglycan hydrolase-like protein with peptidoglycan-binding domain